MLLLSCTFRYVLASSFRLIMMFLAFSNQKVKTSLKCFKFHSSFYDLFRLTIQTKVSKLEKIGILLKRMNLNTFLSFLSSQTSHST